MLIPVSKNKIHQVFGASGYMVRTFTKFIDDLTPNGIPHRKECHHNNQAFSTRYSIPPLGAVKRCQKTCPIVRQPYKCS